MNDCTKSKLQHQGIQLWKPPYYGVKGAAQALEALCTENPFEASDLPALQAFRSHALDKLRRKAKVLEELRIKVVGMNVSGLVPHDDWAELVATTEDRTILMQHVNPDLTLAKFLVQFRQALQLSGTLQLLAPNQSILTGEGTLLARLSPWMHEGWIQVLCVHQQVAGPESDSEIIASLRQAARDLQGGSSLGLEVTDASGNLVPMSRDDQLSFLTALGLHAIGRERMPDASALQFLLQADAEWKSLDETWKSKVDNYGLLQLDICWMYLKLESIEALNDTKARLKRAEDTLRKQVHVNFVTLALVQADMGKPVPPMAEIFVRLFLLQGIAAHLEGETEKGQELLAQSASLLESLRNASPDSSIQQLLEVMDITRSQAIHALRRSQGDVNEAAAVVREDEEKTEEAERKRSTQNDIGLCQNGKAYVYPRVLEQLQPLLGLEDNGDNAPYLVASTLLRLENNDLRKALDRYQDFNRDANAILEEGYKLDCAQGVHRKRRRIQEKPKAVDEVALMTLISLGVELEKAREALEACNDNADLAMTWLSDQAATEVKNEAAMVTDSSEEEQDGKPMAIEGNTVGGNGAHDTNDGDDDEARDEPAVGEENRTEMKTDGAYEAEDDEDDVVSLSSTTEVYANDPTTPNPLARAAAAANQLRRQRRYEALQLLERVLGDALENQDGYATRLGSDLDEEWGYLAMYKSKS